MKKLIAALVLATSFAAFADDAAKTDAPKPTKKAQEGEEVRAKEAPPAGRRPSRLPRSNSSAVLGDRGGAMGRAARDGACGAPRRRSWTRVRLRLVRLVRIVGLARRVVRGSAGAVVEAQVLVLGSGSSSSTPSLGEALHVVRLEVRRVRVVLEIRCHPEIVVADVEPVALRPGVGPGRRRSSAAPRAVESPSMGSSPRTSTGCAPGRSPSKRRAVDFLVLRGWPWCRGRWAAARGPTRSLPPPEAASGAGTVGAERLTHPASGLAAGSGGLGCTQASTSASGRASSSRQT